MLSWLALPLDALYQVQLASHFSSLHRGRVVPVVDAVDTESVRGGRPCATPIVALARLCRTGLCLAYSAFVPTLFFHSDLDPLSAVPGLQPIKQHSVVPPRHLWAPLLTGV
jgi:hypothetical protein